MRLVNPKPFISNPQLVATIQQITGYLVNLIRDLFNELYAHATRLNGVLPKDGTEPMTGPLVLPSYTVASLPDPTAYTSGIIYVSNETGGGTVAFSDGTNWRRVQDRNVVS